MMMMKKNAMLLGGILAICAAVGATATTGYEDVPNARKIFAGGDGNGDGGGDGIELLKKVAACYPEISADPEAETGNGFVLITQFFDNDDSKIATQIKEAMNLAATAATKQAKADADRQTVEDDRAALAETRLTVRKWEEKRGEQTVIIKEADTSRTTAKRDKVTSVSEATQAAKETLKEAQSAITEQELERIASAIDKWGTNAFWQADKSSNRAQITEDSLVESAAAHHHGRRREQSDYYVTVWKQIEEAIGVGAKRKVCDNIDCEVGEIKKDADDRKQLAKQKYDDAIQKAVDSADANIQKAQDAHTAAKKAFELIETELATAKNEFSSIENALASAENDAADSRKKSDDANSDADFEANSVLASLSRCAEEGPHAARNNNATQRLSDDDTYTTDDDDTSYELIDDTTTAYDDTTTGDDDLSDVGVTGDDDLDVSTLKKILDQLDAEEVAKEKYVNLVEEQEENYSSEEPQGTEEEECDGEEEDEPNFETLSDRGSHNIKKVKSKFEEECIGCEIDDTESEFEELSDKIQNAKNVK
eukprot:235264_1